RQECEVCQKTVGGVDVEELGDGFRNFVEAVNPESHLHAPLRAELVDQHGNTVSALHVLKEQGRPAGAVVRFDRAFGDAVGNLGDLQNRIDFSADSLQLAGAIQGG